MPAEVPRNDGRVMFTVTHADQQSVCIRDVSGYEFTVPVSQLGGDAVKAGDVLSGLCAGPGTIKDLFNESAPLKERREFESAAEPVAGSWEPGVATGGDFTKK